MKKYFIDPWGASLIEDYQRVIKDFGITPFDEKILSKLPNPNRLMRRFVVFGHQDLEIIVNALQNKKDFAILTGIMPSGEKLHFGNKMVVEMVKYFQDQGGEAYVLVADLEALATRNVSLEEAERRAMNFHIPAYIALGLDSKKTYFYFQSKNKVVRDLAYEFSTKLTLNEFRALYGNLDAGKIMSVLTQIGDILYPQTKKIRPVVVPVGIDQSVHIRACRDVVRRYKKINFILPSATYHKFTPSLDGSIKMSKSKPGSYIEIPEDPEVAGKKMLNAVDGGRKTAKEQRRLGGEPEKCVIFEFYKQHLIEDDKELNEIYRKCKAGELLCGEDKARACELMKKFMEDFNKKFEKAKDEVDKVNIISHF
ncbi:MAG: tryptophan--tRNA ligase [Candidatus Aenigmatarchaeota archaeon]